jgi:hypothetical protein
LTWIRVDTTLMRHPKVSRFAKAMGMSRHAAVGILIDLWCWCVDYTEGGDLSRISSDDLMAALGVAQDTALIKFDLIESLVTAGFIDREGERIVLHDWDIHQGQLLAQRDANRERQRRHRRIRGGNGAVTVTSPLRNASSRDGNAATERYVTKRNVTERRESASLLAFDDLLPVTSAHVDRWRPLFPNLDIAVELEAMHAYLVAAPANRRPKRSLAKFAINWLKRSAKEGKSSEVGDQREASNLASRIKQNEAAQQQVAATKPVSKKSMEQAKAEIAQLFGPSHRE